jgi:hypothetical protein
MNDRSIEHEGRVWRRCALALPADLQRLFDQDRAGARIVVSDEAWLAALTALAKETLPDARPVRVIAFDKSTTNNWSLGWHQDRVVALRERIETPGFSNWTRKDGAWHAEPPLRLLQRMIFARAHVDASTEDNGCLRLALGSHRHGKIAAADAEALAQNCAQEDCLAEPGDVLFAQALMLHRSGPSRVSSRRRALRVDFCAADLPAPLAWA